MRGLGSALKGLSADMLAAGLIEAARMFRVDPVRVYDLRVPRGKTARACVAVAVLAAAPEARKRRGFTKDLAFVLNLNPTAFAPSGLARCGVVTDHLLGVVEAMRARGLAPAALSPAARSRSDAATSAPIAVARARTSPAAPAHASPGRRFDPASLNDGPRRRAATPTPDMPPQPDVRIEATDALRAMFGNDQPLIEACLKAGGMPVIDFTARPPRIVGGPARTETMARAAPRSATRTTAGPAARSGGATA